MGYFHNVLVLLWKNMKLQLHHPWVTLIEILIPFCFLLLLILLRHTIAIDKREIETIFDAYDINSLPVDEFNVSGAINLYYSPKSTFIDQVMGKASEYLNVTHTGYDTEEELEAAYKKTSGKVIAGVIFPSSLKDGLKFYGPISFTIRPENIPLYPWNLTSHMPPFPSVEISDKTLYGTYYMTKGFIPVQHAVTKVLMENIISIWTKTFDDMFAIRMRRLPIPPYESDSFYQFPEYYFTIAIAIGFLYPFIRITKNIVHERQTNLKQLLILMGVSNWENWLAWYIKNIISLFLLCLMMTFMLCTKFGGQAVFNSSDSALILLWLLLYSLNIVTLAFFISMFFRKEKSAISAACIIFILTFLPLIHTRPILYHVPTWTKFVLCLLPNALFAYSVRIIVRLESLK